MYMYYWAFFTLLIVLAVKYYTAAEMRRLEHRLETVRDDLQRVKQKLQEAQERQNEAEASEEAYTERFRRMKETIEDLQIRLSTQDELEETVAVSNSAPSSVPF